MPDVCTASPSTGKAFCDPHCKYLSQHAPNVPQGLKDFLKFCGAIKQGVQIKLTMSCNIRAKLVCNSCKSLINCGT